MKADFLTIGELGRQTDTKPETIRYYEQVGLLPPPARAVNNYRAYDAVHLNRLSFIRRSRDLGFSVGRITRRPCGEMQIGSCRAAQRTDARSTGCR